MNEFESYEFEVGVFNGLYVPLHGAAICDDCGLIPGNMVVRNQFLYPVAGTLSYHKTKAKIVTFSLCKNCKSLHKTATTLPPINVQWRVKRKDDGMMSWTKFYDSSCVLFAGNMFKCNNCDGWHKRSFKGQVICNVCVFKNELSGWS